VEGDSRLFNPYGVILINPERHPHVKAEMGRKFIDWLISESGQETISEYRIDGHPAFFRFFLCGQAALLELSRWKDRLTGLREALALKEPRAIVRQYRERLEQIRQRLAEGIGESRAVAAMAERHQAWREALGTINGRLSGKSR